MIYSLVKETTKFEVSLFFTLYLAPFMHKFSDMTLFLYPKIPTYNNVLIFQTNIWPSFYANLYHFYLTYISPRRMFSYQWSFAIFIELIITCTLKCTKTNSSTKLLNPYQRFFNKLIIAMYFKSI